MSGRAKLALLALIVGALALLASRSAAFLVVDRPERADAILVLDGENDRRPERAMELFRQGYAPKVVLNLAAGWRIYGIPVMDVARQAIQALPPAEAAAVSLCPITGLSTKAEAKQAAACLRKLGARSALIVTSDYHTRRALDVLRREVPDLRFSVAAAHDPEQFGTAWWKHRQWAKRTFDEWVRLAWWWAVDRWR
jgi:hypothetical protein